MKPFFLTILCFLGLFPSHLLAQDVRNREAVDKFDEYSLRNYSGKVVTVTKGADDSVESENLIGYLETYLTNTYSCFENKITISQITSNIDENLPVTTLYIKLNNEDMSEYITPAMRQKVQNLRQMSYSFSCEKNAIWVKVVGQDRSASEFRNPQFAFSFFAVPEARNLQKIDVNNQ